MARRWYAYDGFGDPLLISSFTLSTIPPNCRDGANVCALYVPNGGSFPSVLSTNIRAYIANILLTSVAQPDGFGIKKYVYGKN